MPQFSDDYFRDLPPRDRRYDTPVADQLVFSVFPNGVKAWVHVYPCDDFVRRRTIGLFPETGYPAALEALEQSRRIAEVDSMETRQPPRPVRRGLRHFLFGLLTALLASGATWFLIGPGDEEPAAIVVAVPSSPGSAEEGVKDVRAGAATHPGMTDGDGNAPEQVAVGPETGIDDEASGSPDNSAGDSSAQPGQEPTSTETIASPAGQPESVEPPNPTGQASPGPVIQTPAPAPVEATALPAPPQVPSESEGMVTTHEPPAARAADESRGDPGVGDRAPPPDDVAASAVEPGGDSAAVEVPRAALAMEIVDREPVGLVIDEVSLPADEILTIYFFTELQGRPGDRIEHRWELEGDTVATIPFVIGGSGHWRVYSSKTIGPGQWRAVVVDDGGREIDALSFEARIEAP